MKAELSFEQREQAAEVLKAMAHPVRLGVLQVLASNERTVSELYEELGCSQSMMSQQLKILAQQKLITIRKEGTQKYCSLCNRDFLKLFDCMSNHLNTFFEGRG